MKKVLSIILKIAIFVFLLFAGSLLATSKFDNPLGIRSFVVQTGSMQPFLPVGSLIFTQKANAYIKNDVIAYKQGNVIVTHRIVDSTSKNGLVPFKTKGDANNATDEKLIDQDEVVGKERIAIPFIGNLLVVARSLPGFILLVIVPALIFIAFEFMTIKQELENEMKKKYQIT